MKNRLIQFFVVAIAFITFASCSKNNDNYFDANNQFQLDGQNIANFVKDKLPLAILDSNSGIWYQIINAGDGIYEYKSKDTIIYGKTEKTVIDPLVTVRYKGQLLDGTIFDQNNSEEGMTGMVKRYIPAWQIAFYPKAIGTFKIGGLTPKGLTKGSKIRIITPSYWAYQNFSNGKIPANSPLDFTIEVVNIK